MCYIDTPLQSLETLDISFAITVISLVIAGELCVARNEHVGASLGVCYLNSSASEYMFIDCAVSSHLLPMASEQLQKAAARTQHCKIDPNPRNALSSLLPRQETRCGIPRHLF